jgi:hypothetical protein
MSTSLHCAFSIIFLIIETGTAKVRKAMKITFGVTTHLDLGKYFGVPELVGKSFGAQNTHHDAITIFPRDYNNRVVHFGEKITMWTTHRYGSRAWQVVGSKEYPLNPIEVIKVLNLIYPLGANPDLNSGRAQDWKHAWNNITKLFVAK